MPKIASFDIFDTLITRAVGDPKAVFLLLGNYLHAKGIIDCSPEFFASARIEAEPLALNKRNLKGVCLDEIYSEMVHLLDISPEKAKELMLLECEMEAKLLKEVPGAKARLLKAEEQHDKVIYLSDMYHSSEFITSVLLAQGFKVNGNCYVSNEMKASKRSGALFKQVASKHPGEYYHFGDNYKSDVLVPAKLKWNTEHFKAIHPTRYEGIMNKHTYATGGLSSAMAGASRLVRLAKDVPSKKSKMIRDISAGVVAPTLVSYILWVLHRANAIKLKKLYFISRDGQIFLKIAQELMKKLDFDIELHYLYGSRKAWQFACITNLESELNWLLKKIDGTSLTSILSRMHIDPHEIEDVLKANNFKKKSWENEITTNEISTLKKLIVKKEIKGFIEEKIKAKREVVYQYFQQEGLTEPENWALVDIGWAGNGQNFMGKILSHYKCKPPRGFYFCLKDKEYHYINGIKEGYIWDRVNDTGYSKLLINLQSLIETFCIADHGSVIDLQVDGDKISPVLEYQENNKALEWGLKLTHEVCVDFSASLFMENPYINPKVDMRPVVANLITAFGRTPTKEEAKAWGTFMFEENQLKTRYNYMAEPYRYHHLIHIFLKGSGLHQRYSWLEGSLALTPRPLQALVKLFAKSGKFTRKLLGKEDN